MLGVKQRKKKEREVRQVRKGKKRSSGRRKKMTDCGSGRKKKNPYNFLNTRAAVRNCGGSLQPRRAQTSGKNGAEDKQSQKFLADEDKKKRA